MSLIHRDTDYAVRVLLELATADDVVPVAALAEAADVPQDFLRKIMQRLHAAGVVRSRQGPSGGYALVRDAAELNLLELVEVIQGPLVVNRCFPRPEICSRSSGCPLRGELAVLQDHIETWLREVTLARIAGGMSSEAAAAGR